MVSGLELDLDHELVVLTAAHCVAGALEPTPDGSSWSIRLGFLLSLDNDTFYEVVPYRVGYPLAGYDLAIMAFRETVPVVAPLHMGSWEAIDFGTEVRNFANPLGMGLQYFSGMVDDVAARAQRPGARELDAVASQRGGVASGRSRLERQPDPK